MNNFPKIRKPFVLSVEDDPDLLVIISEIANRPGHDQFVAGEGQQAIAILAGMQPLASLMLINREMPRLSGLALMIALQRNHKLASIPVVNVSAAEFVPLLQGASYFAQTY